MAAWFCLPSAMPWASAQEPASGAVWPPHSAHRVNASRYFFLKKENRSRDSHDDCCACGASSIFSFDLFIISPCRVFEWRDS
jgi:hypothetical protein